MKKLIRLIITIIFFPIWYPISAFAFSIFGLVPMLGFACFFGNCFMYLLGDKERQYHYLEELKEGFLMGSSCIWLPFLCGKDFIFKGHFRDLNL